MTTGIIYRSKIGFVILIPIVLALAIFTTIVVMNSAWVAVGTCTLTWLLLANIYTKTHYKITADSRLIIRNWIFESWEIETKDIVSIRDNSVLSTLLLSLDRLEINYNGGQVSISPRNKKQFVGKLTKINPNIQISIRADEELEAWEGLGF